MGHAILIIIGLGIAVFAFLFLRNIAHHKMFRRGWAIFIWRFMSGAHWDGNPQTDAGWKRKGTKALTKTGYAPKYYFWPRWKRALLRCTMVLCPPPALAGFFLDSALTVSALSVAFSGGIVWFGFKMVARIHRRSVARDWLQPLHARIAPLAGVPLSVAPSSWLSLTKERDRAVLELPESFNDSEPARERLLARASEALGMEEPDFTWMLEGKHQRLMLEASAPPPNLVNLGHVWRYVKESEPDALIMGLGKKALPVDISLHLDSPHVGASFGAGGGKSTLARFVAAQALYKGSIVIFLDIKRISHTWARGLPNVIYADTPELIHEALVWLGTELDRRNEVALVSADVEGEVTEANVGARIVIVAEELNLTANRLKSYWLNELNGTGQSPAIVCLQDVAFAGRQVLMNIFFIGQMLTARAVGGNNAGGEARENIGVRMLARYTKKNWQMLVPEHPMPLVSDVIGRIQVVASGKVRECQVPIIRGQEAKDMATSGTIAKLPNTVPTILLNPYASLRPGLAKPRTDQDNDTIPTAEVEIVPETPELVTGDVSVMPSLTLTEIIDQHLFPNISLAAIRKARQRDPTFPQPLPEPRGLSHVYDLGQVAEWYQMKYGGK